MAIAPESTSPTLMERLRDPADHEAWKVFYEIYTRPITAWLKRSGVPASDLDERASDVMLRVYRQFVNGKFVYDSNRSFRSWLKTVCCRAAIDHYRRTKRREFVSIFETELLCEGPSSYFESREFQTLVWQDTLSLLVRKGTISEKHARAFVAVHEGTSDSEVAAELGMTAKAVQMANIRITRKLHEILGDS
ncbi:MAG: sigma-70 family RNA polymerase sigma factor [Planctomycetaceae bacterium]|nr:sigma-70 family RNA polymerase sigma factor [Planctomycetaceae bacterium]